MVTANSSKKTLFVLTMGDPAGVGPEICIKAIESMADETDYGIVVAGDISVLTKATSYTGSSPTIIPIKSPSEWKPGVLNVIDLNILSPTDFAMGKVQANCGKAAYAYIIKAIQLAREGLVAGIVTNPINKKALEQAAIPYPGHTEILAHETHTKHFSMLFLLHGVGVAHVTTHCSLRSAIDLISKERIVQTIRLLHESMKRLGVNRPRLAVGGLNPHAGENGLFGTEEIRHIAPAIAAARDEAIDVTGPYPPDTVFMRAFRGEFDGVVAMLHDHGFVALKSLDFEHGVNITVGLPIIRTSVGHGTAFDIAGTGSASDESLRTAITTAWLLYQNRHV
jgi:4-phospho-D-threonate 3-dehydrogenase / 4-phospho-D-erythronate 3-dehydrogenase